MWLRLFTMLALASPIAPAAAQSGTVERHAGTPPGTILESVTVKAGATTLFLSGQVASPMDLNGAKTGAQPSVADLGDTRAQTVNVLGKIRTILIARGFAMSDVVKLTVYVVGDPKLGGRMDFAGMNAGFKQFFGISENPNTVTRSTVQVVALAAPAYLVEIEATAAR